MADTTNNESNSSQNKFVFNGELYTKDSSGVSTKILNTNDVKAGDGIAVSAATDGSVTISSDLGLSLVDGALCQTFESNEEV